MEREAHPSLFRRAKRAWLYARAVEAGTDRVLCCYCDFPMVLRTNILPTVETDGPEERAATLDHVVPGRGNGPDNVVAACSQCNFRKGDRSPAEWAADDGPSDAVGRASRECSRYPSARALALVRSIYGLQVPGEGAWSEVEPPGEAPPADEFLW